MMPRLTPCSSSPPPGAISSTKMSVISATIVSDWPTPTVSTSTTSAPQASTSRIASRERRATPPSAAWLGLGRMKAPGARASRSMRVLSPRIDPPVRTEDGSTASTASFRPRPVSISPSVSMKLDLPTPGVPVRPTRSVGAGSLRQRLEKRTGLGPMVRPGRIRPA